MFHNEIVSAILGCSGEGEQGNESVSFGNVPKQSSFLGCSGEGVR